MRHLATTTLASLLAAVLLGLAPTGAAASDALSSSCVTGCLREFASCTETRDSCRADCHDQLKQDLRVCYDLLPRKRDLRRCMRTARNEATVCLEACGIVSCFDAGRECIASCR